MDAIHPDMLRQIVRDAIDRHVDFQQLEILRRAEREERDILKHFQMKPGRKATR